MPNCPKCRADVEYGVANCPGCNSEFRWPDRPAGAGGADAAADVPPAMRRPDGTALIGGGAALLAAAVLAFLIAISIDTDGYGGADRIATQWLLTLAAGAMFQVGLFLALAGALVRAIWFLPGEELKRRQPKGESI